MIKQILGKVVEGQDLTEAEMIGVMDQIMGGEATDAQIAAFITALRLKGETVAEITGAARVMRARATPISARTVIDIDREEINVDRETVLDTCGTGGSGTRSFNISTTVAFVVAACGVKVAKHGNRSISSTCGSADVLEKLGVELTVSPEKVGDCIQKLGIGFLFAPALHGAMKYAIGPRKEIGIRTIFNLLGPLTNPAGADRQVLGVYRRELVPVLARVLSELGCRRGFVVHGSDGMDEITLTGATSIAEITNDDICEYEITPEQFGLERCRLQDLQGGDARCNADIVHAVLSGDRGPKRDIVVLNSAYSLVAAGVVADVVQGVQMAEEMIDQGAALAKLEALVEETHRDS